MYRRIRKFLLDYVPLVLKAALIKGAPAFYTLFEIQPTSCTIMLTDRCNLRCVMCGQWRRRPGPELSTEDWKYVIDDLARNGIRSIHFSGGEPLLRQESLRELIRYSHKNGMTTGVTTNGLLLSEELLRDLVKDGLVSLALSMDAVGEEYDAIRGAAGAFERIKTTATLVSNFKRGNRMDACINFTLLGSNLNSFRDVKGYADELALPVTVCLLDKSSSIFDIEENKSRFWISGEGGYAALKRLSNFLINEKRRCPASLLLNFPMIAFIEKYFKDPRQADIPCISSQDRIIIDACGNLMGGCLAMGHFGNIKEVRFSELKRDKRYAAAKRRMFYKRCAGCSCGYQFNIKSYTPLMVEDLLTRIGYACFVKN